MKLVDHFTTFLTDTVNINLTRLDQLDASAEALKRVIRESDWGPRIREFVPQGSWAHKTIIKPIEGNPFDADLLVFVEEIEGWSAKAYITTLKSIFESHNTYKDRVRRFSHCVTIEYAGERKIDIAPCVVNRGGTARFEVCNHTTDTFEQTEPKLYSTWLIERDAWAGGNGLRKATMLLKYLRDIKTTFTCKSILLTTLLGMQIGPLDRYNEVEFGDVPTSLKTLVNRLDNWLQLRPTKPIVTNPVLASETLSNLWTEEQYANFRNKFHAYREWVDDAYAEADRDESIGKWRRVFGDDFAKGVSIEKAAKVSDEARSFVRESLHIAGAIVDDLVALVSRFGLQVLPPSFNSLPHKQRPKWKPLPNPLFQVVPSATLHTEKEGTLVSVVQSGTGPLQKGRWLNFSVRTCAGTRLSADFEVHWRITNTDAAAAAANHLRGGFERANDGMFHWEALEYRGVHTAEAFVVRKRDNALVAQSEPFYVVIG